MFLIAQAATTQTVRMPTSATMPVLLRLLQARQLLESNIAEFAALQATREDIVKMRQALQLEERELASSAPGSSESGDMQFHLAIAEATHNSMLVELFRQSWQWRENNPMWIQLHSHLDDSLYRKRVVGRSQTDPRRVNQKRCPSGEAGNVAASGECEAALAGVL